METTTATTAATTTTTFFKVKVRCDFRFNLPCVPRTVNFINKEIKPLFFFFSFSLFKLLKLIIHQKFKARAHLLAFVFPGLRFSLCWCPFVFAGMRFSLCEGHNPWHTHSMISIWNTTQCCSFTLV
jgi:hypothetical protein